MFRILLITFFNFILICLEVYAAGQQKSLPTLEEINAGQKAKKAKLEPLNSSVNKQKSLPTLEEINADLKAKKAKLEPFNSSDVKIDIESLGLDNVDQDIKKTKEVDSKKEASPQQKSIKKLVKKLDSSKKEQTKKQSVEKPIKKEAKKIDQNPIKKFIKKYSGSKGGNPKKDEGSKSKLNIKGQPKAKKSINKITKKTKSYIKQKREKLKKRLKAKKRRKQNQIKQKERRKKLKELRKKYLHSSTLYKKIIPRKKDLNPFINENVPALPILNHYRHSENIHIPLILTPQERINILFRTISVGSVRAFNEAYRDIENPNAVNAQGDTILTYALLLRKHAIIASVLSKGADPNRPNKLGYTPLDIAIELLDFRSLKLLADNKADLYYIDAFERTTLMHAARVGFLPAVDLLVSHGVNINAMDTDGFTALAIAYRHKKEVIVQYLLKHGAKTWLEKRYEPEKQILIKELEKRWQ